MKLNNIFKKPVARPIEGVIKADDLTSLKLEIEEYVLTNELEKRLERFLDAYNNYENANGVWISGFFGSGKSHLLKMLALLLENHEIPGINVLDEFIAKCDQNEILLADLKKACSIPSKSILFNIDQKATIISKEDVDALLAVFVKVFDETCGYYGKQAYIAQFERELDNRGLYQKFIEKYEAKAGISWTNGREESLFEGDNIDAAYAGVTETSIESAHGILDKYRSDYKLSIEDFALQINKYIEKQEPNFRLNFFVDEVGQYIADNTKLMTNLQTIAESLATKCKGRAWVIVTAQEDMDTVVGELGKQQSNDFTKIQARFANRLKLTSQDVAEVIQKRLLMKNDDGIELLSKLYHDQSSNFKTLFNFLDGAKSYKNFKDKEHFIQAYPFIPYQFTLFQESIQSLSAHNAFEGQHSSVGERSMLGVFQQVAVQIAEHDIGQLATFDLMFAGIQTAIKANTQRAIFTAEKNLDHPFAVRILKALFLVKYVKSFKPTTRNLCVLMLDGFATNLNDLNKKVGEALKILEQQTYIQRNGEEYEFLTDEEKDIEQEIKHTDVDNSEVIDELAKIIFEQVLKQKKIRYDENGQDYSFTRKLDDQHIGREHELSINIISPFHENTGNVKMLCSHSLGKTELTVVMPPDERIYADLMMYKKTEKYIRHNQGNTQTETISRIIGEKSNQNRRRMIGLCERVKAQMGKSQILVSGELQDISSEDPMTKVLKGFYKLIAITYPNLRMLKSSNFKEQDVREYLNQSGDTLFGNDTIDMTEAEQEMLAAINQNNQFGVRSTLKHLIDTFEKKPYGWYLAAIQCTLAKLCARAKIEVRKDSQPLENDALISAIRNTAQHANLVLFPQVDFSNSQIKALQEFYEDFFDTKIGAKEPKVLGQKVTEALQNKIQNLRELAVQKSQYPFVEQLEPAIEKLKSIAGKSYTFYLTEMMTMEDELLDLKENVIDPITRFMTGKNVEIYDAVRNFAPAITSNYINLPTDQTNKLMTLMEDQTIYSSGKIQEAKTLYDELVCTLNSKLNDVKLQAKEKVFMLRERTSCMDEFSKLNSEQQSQINAEFDKIKARIDQQNIVAVVRETVQNFEDTMYNDLLQKVVSLSQPKEEKIPTPQTGEEEPDKTETKPPKPQPIVAARDIKVNYNKPLIDNEQDVNDYISALKEAMIEEVKSGNRLKI